MPVLGQTPTAVHLNGTAPAIPSGKLGVTFQAGAAYPDPNNPTQAVRDVSAFVDPPGGSTSPGGAWPFVGFTPPDLTGFSWVNQGGGSLNLSNGVLTFADVKNGGHALRYYKSPTAVAPGTNYTVTVALVLTASLMKSISQGGFTNGIALSDGTKYTVYGLYHDQDNNLMSFGPSQYSNAATLQNLNTRGWVSAPPVLWMRLQNFVGVKRELSVSVDPTNVGWQVALSEPGSTYLVETSVGYGFDLWNNDMTSGAAAGSDLFLSWQQTSP